jgi:integrase/recombinase XerD
MLIRGNSVFTPVFSSRLAPVFSRYVDLKRSLGRGFDLPSRTLESLDCFLHDHSAKYRDLNAAAFEAWCHTHEHVSSGVRRVRMLEVRSFCLYRRRTEPQCFVPDLSSFPAYHQRIRPYIFSEAEVTKLLHAASALERLPSSPVRPEVVRLAIALLFTTGIRRGELLALRLGDYNSNESTLHIRETKFYKSRLLPINDSIGEEIDHCLRARTRRKLPVSSDTALIWNASWGGGAYSGTSLGLYFRSLLQKCGIVTSAGKLPRIHDARHSFAVNALLRWYRAGVDIETKLPLLATYLGHGSAVSTHYYLHFIEPLRAAASERFAKHYGELVSPLPQSPRRRP